MHGNHTAPTTQTDAVESEQPAPVATQPAPQKVTKAQLEAEIVDYLVSEGVEPSRDDILVLGDPVVQAGRLAGYTAAWAIDGRWLGPRPRSGS